jgi:hypothetical protein
MTNQQSAPPRYWIFKDTDKSNLLLTTENLDRSASHEWKVDSDSELKESDIVYFWRKEDSSYFYGWGVISSAPRPLMSEGYSSMSSDPPFGVRVRYHVVFPTPIMGDEINDDPSLKGLSGLRQIQENVIEVDKAQAAALNRLIRARAVEAPADPLVLPVEELSEENDSAGDRPSDTTLNELLEGSSPKLSVLSQHILELAGQFANQRKRNRDLITTSCLLFAAIESGAHPPNAEIDNASQFIFYWMTQNTIRSTQYRQALSEFLSPANPERSQGFTVLTLNARKVIETARNLANFVRRQPVTSESEVINARDLVGTLLITMAKSRTLGAAQRLANMDVSLETLREDYFNIYLSEKNPHDDIEQWRKVLIDPTFPLEKLPHRLAPETKSSLPNIDADTPSVKTDLLNITSEVEGFARIIAARDVKTPLSIGVFGDWGSGKSTFMERLQATVEKIAKGVREKKEDEETSFLGNIVQIKFNAWHYAEANLWASLVSHVFENLSFSEKEEKEKAQERKKLFLGKLVTGLAAQKAAEADAKDKEANYENAKTALDGAKQEQIEARLERRDVVINGIWPIVREFLSHDDEAQQQLDAAGALLGKAGLTEEELRREIEASRTTIRRAQWYLGEIRNDPRRWWYLGLILISMVILPIILTFVLTKIGTGQVWARVAEILVTLTPPLTWLGSKRKKVRAVFDKLEAASSRLDEIYKNARKTYDERISLLNEDLKSKQTEVSDAKKLVENARAEVAETITTLREMEPARLLQTFVQERASSEDYRKLLGVIALIRRDFKKLSDLLSDQDQTELRQAVIEILKDEAQKKENEGPKQSIPAEGDSASANVTGDKTVKEPPKELVDEKLKDFRIDRIVLYIDDLDRCPPKQVVDVLQAIHLLLAFELFVVVVGVDARWIGHSLRKSFPEMLRANWEDGGASLSGEERLAKMATPRDYVEKIFQVPFWLKPMDDDASQKLLEGLIPANQISPASGETADGQILTGKARSTAGAWKDDGTPPQGNISAVAGQIPLGATPSLPTPRAGDQDASADIALVSNDGEHVEEFKFVLKPESLSLDLNERNDMVALSRVIGKTPRTLKRFVNIYRIIKAGLKGGDLEAFVGTGSKNPQYQAVLVLLSVAHGTPDVAPTFFRELKKAHEESVTNKQDVGMSAFLQSIAELPSTVDESLQPEWASLIRELEAFAAGQNKNEIQVETLREWLPVIVRYTFQLGRLSEEVANRKARIAQVK